MKTTTNTILQFVLCLIISFGAVSCSSGENGEPQQQPEDSQNPDQDQDPDPDTSNNSFDLTGKLTFEEFNPFSDTSVGIVEIDLPSQLKKRLGTGKYPWRHPNGELVLIEGCGEDVNRFAILENDGRETVVSPCSSEIENPGFLDTRFEFARLSPDKTSIVGEAKFFLDDGFRYSTVVFKDGALIKVYDGFWAPEWLPDGRVILAADGLYIASIDGEPTKIDDGTLSSGPNNPDYDPNSQRLAFQWNQQIWVMDLDGGNLAEVASGNDEFLYPAWSPDGKYLAFMAKDGSSNNDFLRGVHILEVATGNNIFLNFETQLDGPIGNVPQGPLSWTP